MDAATVEVMIRVGEGPVTGGSDQRGEDPGGHAAADLAGGVTSPRDEASADARTAQSPTPVASSRAGPQLSARQIGPVTAGPRPATAHESAVLAAIAAAYDVAAQSGSISIRSHDLLRRLNRSARVIRDATARVEQEVRTHPDAASARDALALLNEVSRIGLFYGGSVQ